MPRYSSNKYYGSKAEVINYHFPRAEAKIVQPRVTKFGTRGWIWVTLGWYSLRVGKVKGQGRRSRKCIDCSFPGDKITRLLANTKKNLFITNTHIHQTSD